MANRQKEIKKAVDAELKKAGVTDQTFHVAKGSTHQYAQFTLNGVKHKFHFSLTPSCSYAAKKACGLLRRRIREWQTT